MRYFMAGGNGDKDGFDDEEDTDPDGKQYVGADVVILPPDTDDWQERDDEAQVYDVLEGTYGHALAYIVSRYSPILPPPPASPMAHLPGSPVPPPPYRPAKSESYRNSDPYIPVIDDVWNLGAFLIKNPMVTVILSSLVVSLLAVKEVVSMGFQAYDNYTREKMCHELPDPMACYEERVRRNLGEDSGLKSDVYDIYHV